MSQRSLSYQYGEIKKYQEINNTLPQHLVPYCIEETTGSGPDISLFDDQLNEIISSITRGDNPNIIVFRNLVKFYVNKLHQANYQEYLQKLKSLDFSSKENIHYLGSELVVCALRCTISVKGFTFQEDPKYKSVPEICADIAKQFSSFLVKGENGNISFHEELMKLCQQYFYDFVDLNKSLDENNEHTSDNYKGFMTFMGLLYSRGAINIKAVIDCIDTIKHSVFCSECKSDNHPSVNHKHSCTDMHDKLTGFKKMLDSKLSKSICYYDCDKCGRPSLDNILTTYRKHIECVNLHKGYEHLITHVIHSLESRITDLITSATTKSDNVKLLELLLDNIKKSGVTQKVKDYITSNVISKGTLNGNLGNPVETTNVKTYNDIITLFPNLNQEMITNFITSDLTTAREQHVNSLAILDKLCEYLEIIIKSHQEFVQLNQYYKAINKNQLVAPFKPYVVITHNSIGSTLNKLQDSLSQYNTKYTTKYKPISVGKS